MDEAGEPSADDATEMPSKLALGGLSYSFGPFQFSATRHLLTLNGKPVRLGSRATSILSTLVERPGELISKDDLVARAWPTTHVEEGNLRVHIAALRRALGDSSDLPTYIVNVAGRGYRFVAPVQRLDEPLKVEPTFDVPATPVRGGLPTQIAHVIGREDDLDTLAAMLSQSRLVTLAGPGGIGKTTAALALAHRLKHQFQAGAWFVDLAAVSDATVVPFAVASALKLAIDTDRPVESLTALLRSEQALLVFDNCEHVIGDAALVAESVLRGAVGIRILATSHEPLRTEGERVYRLAPFELPADAESLPLRHAVRHAAVELFVERMMANDDGFEISDADVPFIVDICRKLDGLPLAIEIAASRAGVLGIAELAARLDDRFSILTGGRRTAAARHQTLRNMLDWSHDNLIERDRTVLRRLAVFAGEFTLEAAAMVAGDEALNTVTVTEAVSGLVRKSLLLQSTREGTAGFRMLDSTRLYAIEKLAAAGEVQRARQLHLLHLCDLLQLAETSWNMTPVPTWIETHARLIDDIRSALGWAFGSSGDISGGVLLSSLAMPLALQLGLVDEFRERLATALQHARSLPQPLVVPELRLLVAKNAFTYNTRQQIDDSMTRARELAESTGLDRHRVEPLIVLSASQMIEGQYHLAAGNGELALELAHRSGDDFAVLAASRVMAQVSHFLGHHARAIELATAVLQHPVRNIPLTYGFVHTDRRISMRVTMVRSLWMSGRGDDAVRVAGDGLAIAPDAGAMGLVQLLGLAVIPLRLWRGEYDIARHLTETLREEAERYAVRHWENWAKLFDDVIAWRLDGRPVGSAPGMLQAHTLSTMVGLESPQPPNIDDAGWCAPELIRLRGESLVAEGRLELGEAELLRGRELARQHGAIAWELRCAISLARLWQDGGRRADGASLLSDVLDRLLQGHGTADPAAARVLLDQLS